MRKLAPSINIINSHGLPGPTVDTCAAKKRAKAGVKRVLSMVHAARARTRQRRQLAALDERMLLDIGVDRDAVRRETAKPGWRA